MPTILTIQAAIRTSCSPSGEFTTVGVINQLLGAYYCNVSTPPCFSFNAKIGKIIANLPNIQNLGKVTVYDRNRRKSKSNKWRL